MAEPQATTPNVAGGATSGKRGPAYPSIGLEDAVKLAHRLWDKEKKNAVPVASAAIAWGYSEKSSSVRGMVAATIAFGLLKDIGSGDDRKVQLSERALNIVLDAPDKLVMLQTAVRGPKIYADLLQKWSVHELPSDNTLKLYLIKDYNLNANAVDGFLKDFRASIGYAKLDKAAALPQDNPDSGNDQKDLKIGDYVQWEPNGVLQFSPPKKITQLSHDGQFAFVEGSSTGLPVGELTVVEGQTLPPGGTTPLGVPVFKPAPVGSRQDIFSLNEGQVILQWPAQLSQESYDDFESWVQLQLRKIKRSIQ